MSNKKIERKQLRPVEIGLRFTAPTSRGPNNGSTAAGLRLDPRILDTTFKLNPPNLSALPDLSPSEFWAHYMDPVTKRIQEHIRRLDRCILNSERPVILAKSIVEQQKQLIEEMRAINRTMDAILEKSNAGESDEEEVKVREEVKVKEDVKVKEEANVAIIHNANDPKVTIIRDADDPKVIADVLLKLRLGDGSSGVPIQL
ncbi:unnamed protein product [Penicillium salamii]|nr:unnamed protein product [Penicillium salamii]